MGDGILDEESLVNFTANLPNGTTLYRRAVFVIGSVPSTYVEEVFVENHNLD